MSKQSEGVKSWRRRFRLRVLTAMGKCCSICRYDKCDWALDVHHLDPDQKDFTFGGVRGHPQAALSLVSELRKCTLLCKNCHLEVHAGITPWPTESSFDERHYVALVTQEQPRNGNRFGAFPA
jgi:hypothetical protein